ncbi:hypothetical protein HUJ04_006238 [Dendroctonus ponderosae]|nr:hypothetical protein HUJ04_006238 [Dendroctonus ponderosae]
MDGAGGGRRRVAAKSSAEDQALDQIAKEIGKCRLVPTGTSALDVTQANGFFLPLVAKLPAIYRRTMRY